MAQFITMTGSGGGVVGACKRAGLPDAPSYTHPGDDELRALGFYFATEPSAHTSSGTERMPYLESLRDAREEIMRRLSEILTLRINDVLPRDVEDVLDTLNGLKRLQSSHEAVVEAVERVERDFNERRAKKPRSDPSLVANLEKELADLQTALPIKAMVALTAMNPRNRERLKARALDILTRYAHGDYLRTIYTSHALQACGDLASLVSLPVNGPSV